MLRLTTCSDWLNILLACHSEKLKLVAFLVSMVMTPAAVDNCLSCLVFLTDSFSDIALLMIDSIAPQSTRAFTRQVSDFQYLLPSGMTKLTKIIGLKCTEFSDLLDLFCLSSLVGFCRFLHMWSSCNALSKLLELIVCSQFFDSLLGFNLLMIISSLQPLSQLFFSLPLDLLLHASLSEDSES